MVNFTVWILFFYVLSFFFFFVCFVFFFFGCVAYRILVPQPEIKPIPATLEGRVLTTTPLGKSPIVWVLPQLKNNKLIQNKIWEMDVNQGLLQARLAASSLHSVTCVS